MPYTIPQRQAVIDAMVDAFDMPTLARAVRLHLGVRRAEDVADGARRNVVGSLVALIEGCGWGARWCAWRPKDGAEMP